MRLILILTILFNGALWSQLSAQQDSVPVRRFINIKRSVKEKLRTAPTLFETLRLNRGSASGQNTYYSLKSVTAKIERSIYNENVFNIGEIDNPFALDDRSEREGRKRVRKKNAEGVSVTDFIKSMTNKKDERRVPGWLILVLLGTLIFATIMVRLNYAAFEQLFRSFLLGPNSIQKRQVRQSGIGGDDVGFYILFMLSMGTFLYLLPIQLSDNYSLTSFLYLLAIMFGVGGVYVLRHTTMHFLSFILPVYEIIQGYSFLIANTNKVIAFILIPFLFLIVYGPEGQQYYITIVTAFLLGAIYSYRTICGLILAEELLILHKVHFFLYICTVEVAPVLVLLKLLSII